MPRPSLRNDEQRNELALKHRGLIVPQIQRLRMLEGVARLGMDDAFQEGFIGLMRAAELWDESRGVPFVPYAQIWIRQRIRYAGAKAMKAPRQERDFDNEDGDLSTLIASRETPPDVLLGCEDVLQWCDRALWDKPQNYRQITQMRLRGMTVREIAQAMGLDLKAVKSRVYLCFKRLRKEAVGASWRWGKSVTWGVSDNAVGRADRGADEGAMERRAVRDLWRSGGAHPSG